MTDVLDLGGLRLSAGEGRSFELAVHIEPLTLGGEPYEVEPTTLPVKLDVSRMLGNGYALRLRFLATLVGPCMRCLKDAAPQIDVDAREVDRPGGGEELSSPYLEEETLDLAGWARDALRAGLADAGAVSRGLRRAVRGVRRRSERDRPRAHARASAGPALGKAQRVEARVATSDRLEGLAILL